MTDSLLYNGLLIAVFIISVVIFLYLLNQPAPYGRYQETAPKFSMLKRWGWIIMETPAVLFFLYFYFSGPNASQQIPLIFLFMWMVHYIHRSYIYPFQQVNRNNAVTTLDVFFSAFIFNTVNAYLNATWVSTYGDYPYSWLSDPRMIIGVTLFVVGYFINRQADFILSSLRKDKSDSYKIPHGGMYQYISCPNYFGEIILWCGWAMATWSLAGLSFVVFSIANLLPRALSHHAWYQQTFPDYPKERKAIIPFLL